MKALRSIILFVLLVNLSNQAYSQEVIYVNDTDGKTVKNETKQEEPPVNQGEQSKLSYKVDIGTSFSTSKNFGNMLAFYTSPSIRYRLSPKFEITAGAIFINTNIGSYYTEKQRSRITKSYMTAGINYYKEKLKISGEILFGMNKSPFNPYENKTSPEYYARFSAEYKITESLSIGLQIINHNMTRGDYYNPYGSPFYNPYRSYNPVFGY